MISGKWQQLLETTGFTRASTDELWLANCYFDSHRACNNVASSRRMLFISKALLILAEHRCSRGQDTTAGSFRCGKISSLYAPTNAIAGHCGNRIVDVDLASRDIR
jgi:hypothetical protein